MLENDLRVNRAVIGRHAFIHHLEFLHRSGIGRIEAEIIEQDPGLIGRSSVLRIPAGLEFPSCLSVQLKDPRGFAGKFEFQFAGMDRIFRIIGEKFRRFLP